MSAAARQYRIPLSGNQLGIWIIAVTATILAIGSIYISHYIQTGDNYSIYKYMSEYRNSNGVYPSLSDGSAHPISPNYFDYSPMNATIYRLIFMVDGSIQQILFVLYQLSMLIIGLLCMQSLVKKGIIPSDMPYLAILFFLLNPLVYRMLAADDKVGFFMWPPICAVGAELNIFLGAAVVGVFGGWTGLGVAAIPTLPSLARANRWHVVLLLGVASTIVVAMLLMHGSESVLALKNRAARELMEPFSDSIWRWLPAAWWPEGRYPLIALFIGFISLLAWKNRIPYFTALVSTSSTYLLFSNNTVPTRILFFTPLLMICFLTKRVRVIYILGALAGILISHGLRRFTPGFNPDGSIGVLTCNAILIIPVVNVMLRAIRDESTSSAEDSLFGVS